MRGRIAAMIVALLAAGPAWGETTDPALVGYWPFQGNALDYSSNGNDGTVMGALPTEDRDGNPNAAYEFDGLSAYVSVPNSPSLQMPSAAITMAAEVKPLGWSQVGSSLGPILMKGTTGNDVLQYRMAIGPFGVNSAYNSLGTGVSEPFSFEFGRWYHVASVYDGEKVVQYVDGVPIGSTPFATPMSPNTMALEIGRDVPGFVEYFHGAIDEVRIYFRALSPQEIQELAGVTTTTSTTTTTLSSVTTSTSTTTTTFPGTPVLLSGKKLLVKQKKSGAQRVQVLAKDAGVAVDPLASDCQTQGRVRLLAGSYDRTIPLEPDLWKPIKKKKPERGCKYRKGPIVSTVLLKAGKSLKVVLSDPALGFPLGADPRPVFVEVWHRSVRHCLRFDAGDEGKFKANKMLLSKKSAPPDACPPEASPSGAFLD